MRKSTAAAIVLVLAAVLAPQGASANHAGCYVIGEVQGLDVIRECTYEAPSTTQYVYVGTPYDWEVWVDRGTPQAPEIVTLASGTGPVVGPPPEIHPEAGETVHVWMHFGCTVPYCGTIGFLGAGLEAGHP